MSVKISAIASISRNRGLGKNNQLLYHISEDMKRFKAITTGHPIIMGRKTFESIGRALPNRTNIIISRDQNYKAANCIVVRGLDQALQTAKKTEHQEIFIIGGGQIYAEAMPFIDRLYLTIVDQETPDAQIFFPDYQQFTKKISEQDAESQGLKYKYIILEK